MYNRNNAYDNDRSNRSNISTLQYERLNAERQLGAISSLNTYGQNQNGSQPRISALAQYGNNNLNSNYQLNEISMLPKNRSNQNLNSYSPKKQPPSVGDYSSGAAVIRKNQPNRLANQRINNPSKGYNHHQNSDRSTINRYQKQPYHRNLPKIHNSGTV